MSEVILHAGDNRVTLRRLIDQGVRVHSVVTDPPYGLVSVQKRFGKEGSAAARTEGNDGSFARLSGGFMGKAWDGTGIERDPDFWRLIWEILLPGGYVFAFSGSRTGHWQACAMEMAGFIMHPMHGWAFGSGFPKAVNAARSIDKDARGVLGKSDPNSPNHGKFKGGCSEENARGQGFGAGPGQFMAEAGESGRYQPQTPEAAKWEGWAYGTQAQKPALEPIYLGQKPFSEKTGAANILRHGVGALNIDGCRVPITNADISQIRTMQRGERNRVDGWGMGATEDAAVVRVEGRHPSNLILDGSPEVVAMFPNTKSGKPGIMRKGTNDGACYGAESRAPGTPMTGFGDEGSAARFFHHFPHDTCGLCEQEIQPCDANTAEKDLTILSTPTDASAHYNAADLLPQENADNQKLSIVPATYAEQFSEHPLQTNNDSAQQNAVGSLEAKIAHNAKCAANLCDSCATAFAQSLVQTSQGKSPESLLSRVFITEHKRQILIQSLALIAATPESIATTTTIQNLNLWFGFVFRAIEDATNSESHSRSNVSGGPLRYHPKAGKLDRAGSKHPTVKPIALMQYLIRHITPPGGTVLDPFAGSGTTAEAARREGFDCILMEAEPEYVDFLNARFFVQESSKSNLGIDELSQLLG